jgi:hypothetical protein
MAERRCRVKYWLALTVLLGVVACAGERVTELGAGRYHLAIRSGYGEAQDRAHAAELADNYCRKSGHRAVVEGFDDKGSYVLSPSTGVVFTCQ